MGETSFLLYFIQLEGGHDDSTYFIALVFKWSMRASKKMVTNAYVHLETRYDITETLDLGSIWGKAVIGKLEKKPHPASKQNLVNQPIEWLK